MQDDKTLTEVITIIKKYSERREAAASADASTSILDLGVSSLNFIELVVAFEDNFNVSISDDAMKGISTIGDAVNAIISAQAVAR